jgi:hypothetical protein
MDELKEVDDYTEHVAEEEGEYNAEEDEDKVPLLLYLLLGTKPWENKKLWEKLWLYNFQAQYLYVGSPKKINLI